MASVALPSSPPPTQPSLTAETARLAARLAEFVRALNKRDDSALAELEQFLRSMEEVAGAPVSEARPQPLERLAGSLRMATIEIDLLLLAGLAEEHEGYASAFRLVGPIGAPYPTVGLAAQLLCADGAERAELRGVLERGPAVRSGVLVVDGPGPFFERSLRVGERLWHVLNGIDVWPSGVHPRPQAATLDGLEEWLEEPTTARATTAILRGAPVTVVIASDSEAVALGRAASLALHSGVPAAALDLQTGADEALVRLVGAHALARGCVPLLLPAAVGGPADASLPELGDHPGPVVVCVRTGVAVVNGTRPVLAVPISTLATRSRRRMWSAALPELAADAPLLAARHLVEPQAAAEAAADVRALRAFGDRPGTVADVSASIRARAGISLTAGAKLIRPTATWSQLVLRPNQLAQLHEAIARLDGQSRVLDDWGFLATRPGARGVRMLFAGPPGTGKTLSAEVLASELEVDLLVIDISRMVSKWIGETEKNLAEVFDAAERTQSVLFFDEADALFGRRTEISDAHDRYANLETAYLLTRLERFEGLALLATNLRQNIDPAFTRRLEFAVQFEEPTSAEREALWRCHIPHGAPLDPDVDLAQLAALYQVVGGVIRNAVAAAAFLAASEGVAISRRHLISALRREYEKTGKPFPEYLAQVG